MIDLPVGIDATTQDPLVIAFALMVLGGLATHFLFRRYPLARAINASSS